MNEKIKNILIYVMLTLGAFMVALSYLQVMTYIGDTGTISLKISMTILTMFMITLVYLNLIGLSK